MTGIQDTTEKVYGSEAKYKNFEFMLLNIELFIIFILAFFNKMMFISIRRTNEKTTDFNLNRINNYFLFS